MMTICCSRLAFVVTLVLVLHSCYFIKPAASTSRKALLHHFKRSRSASLSQGFRVELRHVDHGKNLTKLELLQRAIVRGNHRLQQLSMATSMANLYAETGAIKAPIHPGEGEFLMSLSIGTPPLSFSAIVDTGSDLIWTQCNPCVQCYDQPSPVFNPSNSTSYSKLPCSSPLCKSLPQPTCSKSKSKSNPDGFCTYTYEYGDYSTTAGTLASETFTFSTVSVSHIGFGCGDDNEGGGFNQGGGLVGLGRGPLSLVSQLKEPKFSYCLTSMNSNDVVATHDGILLMGSLATTATNATSSVTTPLTRNPAQPSFYYINLIGISVGKTKLSIPKSAFSLKEDGSGGMIIDSGTTITYLEESAFEALKKELIKSVKLKVADDGATQKTGLELCFKLPAGYESGSGPEVSVPRLLFHFEKADLEIPAENYMMGVAGEKKGDPELLCLAMGSGSGMSVFGNIQQQNTLVLHDLAHETLTFAPTKCGGL